MYAHMLHPPATASPPPPPPPPPEASAPEALPGAAADDAQAVEAGEQDLTGQEPQRPGPDAAQSAPPAAAIELGTPPGVADSEADCEASALFAVAAGLSVGSAESVSGKGRG